MSWFNRITREDSSWEMQVWKSIERDEDKADLKMDELKRKMNIAWNDARRRNLRRRMQKLEQRMKAIQTRKLAWKLAHA